MFFFFFLVVKFRIFEVYLPRGGCSINTDKVPIFPDYVDNFTGFFPIYLFFFNFCSKNTNRTIFNYIYLLFLYVFLVDASWGAWSTTSCYNPNIVETSRAERRRTCQTASCGTGIDIEQLYSCPTGCK